MDDITIPRVSIDWQQLHDLVDQNNALMAQHLQNVDAWKASVNTKDEAVQEAIAKIDTHVQDLLLAAVAVADKINPAPDVSPDVPAKELPDEK